MSNKDNSILIAKQIRNGLLDINVQEPFLAILLKGLLLNLNNDIAIRNIPVPHFILHTGDDRMWLEQKGYNASIEPITISNEQNVYNIIPKCIVNTSSISLDTNQLTSPYSVGSIQCHIAEGEYAGIYALTGEFRRTPVKINIDLKYYTDSFTDMLELIQCIIAKLSFIRTFDIVYMGKKIKCSYKMPDSFDEEHTMDIDGSMSDNKEHSLSLSIEVETNMPVFANKTISPTILVAEINHNWQVYIDEARVNLKDNNDNDEFS